MQEAIKFTRQDLKDYFANGFARGEDFAPSFTGLKLVETERAGGVFTRADSTGAPRLRDDFVEHMDNTSFDLRIPYADVAAVLDGMRREGDSVSDERMNGLHRTLIWLAFRRKQVTTAKFAECEGIDERTVQHRLKRALEHVEKALKTPPGSERIVYPASYIELLPTNKALA